jgi:hypothetical protein
MTPPALAGGKPGDPAIKTLASKPTSLQGRLEHIYHVRDRVDRRSRAEKKKNATATRRLYHRFLFYTKFVAPKMPLLIPEGKTDSIYLKAAITRSPAYHPKLGFVDKGKIKFTLEFMKYTDKVHDILQLGGGTGDFKFFMLNYKALLDGFKHRPLGHPVILLVDNDDGAKDVFATMVKSLGVPTISHTSTALFYRIQSTNLYLIKTPETGLNAKTCIEDLFDPLILATKIQGKVFDPNKNKVDHSAYGKLWFADKIIKPQAAIINFSNFGPLLDRVVAVLDDYAASPAH